MGQCISNERLRFNHRSKLRRQAQSTSDNDQQIVTTVPETTGEYENGRKIEKLLLLGSGNSGKSTMFKQIVHLYSTGFSEIDYMGKLYSSNM